MIKREILDSGKYLEVCETLFKIIDLKVYAYIRRLEDNKAIEIANNRANQFHQVLPLGKTMVLL